MLLRPTWEAKKKSGNMKFMWSKGGNHGNTMEDYTMKYYGILQVWNTMKYLKCFLILKLQTQLNTIDNIVGGDAQWQSWKTPTSLRRSSTVCAKSPDHKGKSGPGSVRFFMPEAATHSTGGPHTLPQVAFYVSYVALNDQRRQYPSIEVDDCWWMLMAHLPRWDSDG